MKIELVTGHVSNNEYARSNFPSGQHLQYLLMVWDRYGYDSTRDFM